MTIPQLPRTARRRRRTVSRFLTIVLTATLLLTVKATTAFAASGYGLDGLDPYQTGCASNGAFIVNSAPVLDSIYGSSEGTAYLWYSNGCGTNWVAVTTATSNPEPPKNSPIVTNVYRQSPYMAQTYTWWGQYPAGAHSWSNMVYAPSTCAKGYVSLDMGFDNASTWVYQNSCRF